MAAFWISFRIAYDHTYQDRYDHLDFVVRENSSLLWEETTSFFLFETTFNIDEIGRAIVSKLSSTDDVVIIREVGRANARYWGALKDRNILTLIPGIKSL